MGGGGGQKDSIRFVSKFKCGWTEFGWLLFFTLSLSFVCVNVWVIFFFYFQRWKMICLIFSAENKDGTKFRKLTEWFIYGTAWEFGDTSFSKSELIGYSTTLFMPTNNIKVPLGFQRRFQRSQISLFTLFIYLHDISFWDGSEAPIQAFL